MQWTRINNVQKKMANQRARERVIARARAENSDPTAQSTAEMEAAIISVL